MQKKSKNQNVTWRQDHIPDLCFASGFKMAWQALLLTLSSFKMFAFCSPWHFLHSNWLFRILHTNIMCLDSWVSWYPLKICTQGQSQPLVINRWCLTPRWFPDPFWAFRNEKSDQLKVKGLFLPDLTGSGNQRGFTPSDKVWQSFGQGAFSVSCRSQGDSVC